MHGIADAGQQSFQWSTCILGGVTYGATTWKKCWCLCLYHCAYLRLLSCFAKVVRNLTTKVLTLAQHTVPVSINYQGPCHITLLALPAPCALHQIVKQ